MVDVCSPFDSSRQCETWKEPGDRHTSVEVREAAVSNTPHTSMNTWMGSMYAQSSS